MPSEPRFSILMPTRNRARLLQMALQSALELRGADFEVVVSDNCSSDDTPAVVRQSGDPRVRYVRTPRPLALSANMESLLDQARGEYLIFLNDDDALPASLLERAAVLLDSTGAEVLAWPYCQYFHPQWHEIRARNHLLVWPYTGALEDIPARRALAALYQELDTPRMPNWTNALHHRSVIARARRQTARLFPALLSADVFGAAVLLSVTRRFYWVDVPLMIIGKWSDSVGSSIFARRRRSGRNYLREFPEEGIRRHVPLRTFTGSNLRAEALLQAKTALGASLADLELDWVRYFTRCHADLLYLHAQGNDVRRDFADFRAVLATQPEAIKAGVTTAIRVGGFPDGPTWRQAVRRLVNRVPALARAEAALRGRLEAPTGATAISGREAGFANILDCARVWDRRLADHQPVIR
jgi:glycosyltransferase involved in cell wall biosynthesis